MRQPVSVQQTTSDSFPGINSDMVRCQARPHGGVQFPERHRPEAFHEPHGTVGGVD